MRKWKSSETSRRRINRKDEKKSKCYERSANQEAMDKEIISVSGLIGGDATKLDKYFRKKKLYPVIL